MNTLSKTLACGIAALAFTVGAHSGWAEKTTIEPQPAASSPVADWWNGKYATGNWFGFRDTLEDHGLKLSGHYKANFYGIVSGGEKRGATYDQELRFTTVLNFGKALNIEALETLTVTGSVRWRDGESPNNFAGASSTFNPSAIQSGKQWRLMPFFLTYVTPELFGAKNFLTLSGGWQNPYDFFAQQPDSKLFLNNSIASGKGIGSNGASWSSSYAAWGGYFKVKPLDWYYAQAGFYMAIPDATNTANHGLYFRGRQEFGKPTNGLFFVGETGFTPKWGPSELESKYAAGVYYFGVRKDSFFGESYSGPYGFYFQADQMLFREPAGESVSSTVYDKSTGKKTVMVEEPKLSKQGLSMFNFINFSPKYLANIPFYFQTGLVYTGLIPTRDEDKLGVAFAYGNYSYYKIVEENNEGVGVHQTYEGVIEANYRLQVNKWAYFQPNLQYIIRPDGNGLTQNAFVLGFSFGTVF